MSPLNAYKKGYLGENEWQHTLQSYFPRYKDRIKRVGGTEKCRANITGDVACLDINCILNRFHLENKARESMNLFEVMEKTENDALNKIPLIRWQKNRKKPLYIMREKDLLNILVELGGFLEEKKEA